jgi:hypothetical protein
MKVSELFEAQTPHHPVLADLKGKKLDYEGMIKYLSDLDIVERKGAGTAFTLKKNVGVNLGPLLTALKKAADKTVRVSKSTPNTVFIDWEWTQPVPATVVFNQAIWNFKDGDESNGDEIEKKIKEQRAWAYKNSKGEAGGKGWFATRNQVSYPVFARFDEGPFKDDICAVEHFTGKDTVPMKKGQKILVKTNPDYGFTKLVK